MHHSNLGRVALKPLGPRAEDRLHHGHGEGPRVAFEELDEAEDEGLVVALLVFVWGGWVLGGGDEFVGKEGGEVLIEQGK